MSESPFAFQDEQSVDLTEQATDGSKRNLIALVGLAVAALGAGAFLLLGGSDEPTEETAFVPTKRVPRVAAPAAPPAPALPAESEVQLGDNPFKALVVKPVAAAAAPPAPAPVAPAPAAPVIVVTTGTTGDGAATTTISTSPAPAPKSPAPAPAPAVSTVTFTSVSGSSPVGGFLLDGRAYTAAKGETFAGKVKVVDLRKNLDGAWVAKLQVGDGTPFEIYEGQQVVIP